MKNPNIRAATIDDRDVLARLNAEVQQLHLAARPGEFKPTRGADIADWFARMLSDRTAKAWLAEDDGVAIGYVLVLVRSTSENPFCVARRWWELDQISVAANHRRGGVCRALVQVVLTEAKNQGVGCLELSTWAFNEEAQEAFRRLGFVPKQIRYALSLEPGEASA